MHHSFDINLATLYSVEEAILIHHFQHWVMVNKRLKRNEREGRTWTYQTISEIAAHFPYFSKKQIERIINKLVENEVLIKNNFNKSSYDRTVWYAFKNEDFLGISRNREIDFAESGNQKPEIATPIPDSLTHTETSSINPPQTHQPLEPDRPQVSTWIDRLSDEIQANPEEIKKAQELMKKSKERITNPKNWMKAVILDERERVKEMSAIEGIRSDVYYDPSPEEFQSGLERILRYASGEQS